MSSTPPSPPLSCPYRHDPQADDHDGEIAVCRLAGEVTGVADPEILRVSRALCELCVRRLPLPDPAIPNAYAASLVCVACERIIERGGVPECDADTARKLMAWAAQHLDLAGGRAEMRAIHHGRRDPCLYLGDQTGERPCLSCRGSVRQKVFACSHEAHTDTTILDCARCPDHEARLATGTVATWAVGVTTAPRAVATLERSLRSLADAGWPDALVFAEPDTPLPGWLEFHRVVQRPVTLGAWPNWLLSLQELTLRYPWADAYLLCQDDVLYTRDLRAYLEKTLWPTENTGVVSLHTALHQESATRGFSALGENEVMAWGAQAYVFPNAAARALLRSGLAINHRNRGPRSGLCNIDTIVGQWCDLANMPYFVHSPSPTQHIGDASAIWERGDTIGRRQAGSFPGEDASFCDTMAIPTPKSRSARKVSPPNHWDGTLAICAPTIGRRDALGPWRDWLVTAAMPPRTTLYILDNSGDLEYSELLRIIAIELDETDRFEKVNLHIRRKPPAVPPRHSPQRHWNVADAYNTALHQSEQDEDFVFLLDDDTIPPLDCLPLLYGQMAALARQGENPGAISGCYESAANRGFLVACYSMLHWSKFISVGSLGPSEVVKVGTVGSGCVLFNGPLFWDCAPVRGETIGGMLGPDSYLCSEVRRKGYSVWLHGGVVCDHLSAKH